MSTATIFTIVKTQKQSKCPSMEEWVKKMYTENFKRVTLTNSRLEVIMLRCGERSGFLLSLHSRVLIFISFISHRNFVR